MSYLLRLASLRRHLAVLALLALVTVVMTWPLVARLGTSIPCSVYTCVNTDNVLICWILAWGAHKVLSLDLANFYDGNIFYPSPYSVTYSEHLLGWQPIVLPVYALTGNIVLAANVALLPGINQSINITQAPQF